jgi:hypothetical protein
MRGATSMAPIITAAELVSSPNVAILQERTRNTQSLGMRLVPIHVKLRSGVLILASEMKSGFYSS